MQALSFFPLTVLILLQENNACHTAFIARSRISGKRVIFLKGGGEEGEDSG